LAEYPPSLFTKGFDSKLKKIESDAISAVTFNQAYQVLLTFNTNTEEARQMSDTKQRYLRLFV
jgi:hypothetical protein